MTKPTLLTAFCFVLLLNACSLHKATQPCNNNTPTPSTCEYRTLGNEYDGHDGLYRCMFVHDASHNEYQWVKEFN